MKAAILAVVLAFLPLPAFAQTTPAPTTQPQAVVPTIPPPTVLQVVRMDCTAPVGGTVMPAGFPTTGVLYMICYQTLANVPIAATAPPATPAPTWTVAAPDGAKVLIKAGTTVRYGAPAGTPPGDQFVTVPLAADGYDAPVTYAVDTTLTVSFTVYGGDPAVNYAKRLEMLGTVGGVTVQP